MAVRANFPTFELLLERRRSHSNCDSKADRTIANAVCVGSGYIYSANHTWRNGLRQWARSPIKMTIDEFLAAIQEKIVADRVFDPIAVTQDRLGVIASFVTTG